MPNYYDINALPVIFNAFQINSIIICGISYKTKLDVVFDYCEDNNISYTIIDLKDYSDEHFIKGNILDELPKFNNYDAIFINDDPNWYSVYNELNLVKENNEDFPLVVICNNTFPHKYRDSYINPDSIPDEFKNEYSREIMVNGIPIQDSFYHAIEEYTPKNGVQTAIDDFLSENKSIDLMDIEFINGITILHHLNSKAHLNINKLNEELEGYVIELDGVSDRIIENELLIDYFSRLSNNDLDLIENYKRELKEKEQLLKEFKQEIDLNNTELTYKDSKIDSFDSKLNLKDSQIKNIESKLVNREMKIDTLNNELKNANSKINSLKEDVSQKRKIETKLNNQIKENNEKLSEQNRTISLKDNQLRLKQNELKENMSMLNSLKNMNTHNLAKLDDKEYCISCYKEEIMNNHLEIQYLKKETFLRKLLNPFSYLYLILKSKPNELSLNLKLYKALKNSKCFDIGYYLNNNKDLLEGKWCNYFSPELHYVCNGFNEERRFNKKYFNRNSKEELLEYIINCP